MNILIIGNKGYIGQGLTEYFEKNHKIFGWDKDEDLFNLKSSFIKKNKIDLLINLSLMADRATPKYEIDTPGDHVNVMGARHIAKLLKGSEVAWFQFSTREVLGPIYKKTDVIATKNGYRPRFLIDESYPYSPVNSYGKSKVIAEFISESHPFSNIIRLTTGYTDYAQRGGWVIQLVKNVCRTGVVNLTMAGKQFRDPLHTDDIGNLIEKIHSKGIYGEKFHAGGGIKNLISLKEFVKLVDPRALIKNSPGGDYGFAFDISKAKRLVGWEPQVSIKEKIEIIRSNAKLHAESN